MEETNIPKKEYKNEYLKISKYSVIAEVLNKNKKTSSILIDDIIPNHKFWISTKNVFKNKYFQDNILTISIDLNSKHKLIAIDSNESKKEITTNELLKFYKNWKIEVELMLGNESNSFPIKENFKEKTFNGNIIHNQLKLNDLMIITNTRGTNLSLTDLYSSNKWDFNKENNKDKNYSK